MENVLITGAASGIGRAAAQRLARRMHVIIVDRNGDGAAALAAELKRDGFMASAIEVDVSSGLSVRRMMVRIDGEIGPVHALFNNAGFNRRGRVDTITEDDWDAMMGTHVKGMYLCAQAVLPQMCERGAGAIVNTSSDFAVMGVAGIATYTAAKTAIYSLPWSIFCSASGRPTLPARLFTPMAALCRGELTMRLGIWTPLPHTIRSESEMEAAIRDLKTRGAGGVMDRSFQFAVDVVNRGERYGFETTLIAERFLGPDLESWIMSSALAMKTTDIELMVAVHPGIVAPQVVAKMGATLDRISGGRFAINIVNGWWQDEFNLFANGGWLGDTDRRYRRMDEYIRVMKGLWTEDSFSLDGEFYKVEAGRLPIKTVRKPYPTIYAASRTGIGKEVVARECDVWFVPYEPSHRLYEDNVRGLEREVH